MIDHLKPWDAQACADYLGVSKNHFLQLVYYNESAEDLAKKLG